MVGHFSDLSHTTQKLFPFREILREILMASVSDSYHAGCSTVGFKSPVQDPPIIPLTGNQRSFTGIV